MRVLTIFEILLNQKKDLLLLDILAYYDYFLMEYFPEFDFLWK